MYLKKNRAQKKRQIIENNEASSSSLLLLYYLLLLFEVSIFRSKAANRVRTERAYCDIFSPASYVMSAKEHKEILFASTGATCTTDGGELLLLFKSGIIDELLKYVLSFYHFYYSSNRVTSHHPNKSRTKGSV